MSTLDDFIPEPRLCEIDSVRVGVSPEEAFPTARHFDLARVPLAHALFWIRTLPERIGGRTSEPLDLRLDQIGRTGTGFQVLADQPDRLIVGAVGRFWEPEMTFAQPSAAEFACFAEPGWGKLAWELRCEGEPPGSRLVFELRLTATDDASWRKLRRYFRLIGPFSHFFRRQSLAVIARDLGTPQDLEAKKSLAGDEIIPNPKATMTHAVTIDAPPSAVWPWLVQMGCRRAGWYSYDDLDNAGILSETAIVPELQHIAAGDVLPATPEGGDGFGFTVLSVDAPRALVLGGLVDTESDRGLAMDAPKPAHFFQVSWAFVLELLPGERTRLIVRVRSDFSPVSRRVHLQTRARGLLHHFMESAQLQNLKRRAEGKMPHAQNTWRDVGEGVLGAGLMLADLVTPFLRGPRSHWGMTRAEAEQVYPGDEYVPTPRWQWTHAIDVDATPEAVWPWIAQLGQDKGGFYSYQFLENLAGSDIQNANRVHAEWQSPRVGGDLRLHRRTPPLTIAVVEANRALIAHAGMDPRTGRAPVRDASDHGDVAVSWALLLTPLPDGGTRVVSRFRSDFADDLASRLAYGPYLTESIGFVMDRRMLRGIKQRAERKPCAEDSRGEKTALGGEKTTAASR